MNLSGFHPMKTRSKKRRHNLLADQQWCAQTRASIEEALRPFLQEVKQQKAKGEPLSPRTMAGIDEALQPLIRQIEHQMNTGATDHSHIDIHGNPKQPADAAELFNYIVEHCYDNIAKTALEGDETGQPYVVAIQEDGGVITAGVMFVERG
jgi:hypothetical protein